MKYYVHFGQEVVIDSCPKGNGCAVGPFETLEDAQKWVDSHERICASERSEAATTTDFRVRSQK